jgi:hypothetical protein
LQGQRHLRRDRLTTYFIGLIAGLRVAAPVVFGEPLPGQMIFPAVAFRRRFLLRPVAPALHGRPWRIMAMIPKSP